MVPVLTEVAAGSPDLLFFPIFPPEGNFISQQIGEVSGLENTTLMAADGMLVDNYMEIPESEGVFMSGPDLNFEGNANAATGETGDGFLAAYEAEHGEAPSAAFWAHAYDATTLLLSAIEAASSKDGDNLVVDRAGVREFMAGVSSWPGIIGDISCDAFGDCGSQRIAVVEHNDSSDIAAGKNNVVFTYSPGKSAVTGALSSAEAMCVGLVTDVGQVDDKSFNQSAWEGVLRAADELGADVDYIETQAAKDYATNIGLFADSGCDVIVTVGFALGEATAIAAAEHPDVDFVGVDQFQGAAVDGVAGLIFPEDQAGFLAGALAASMSQSGTIAAVLGTDLVPPVLAFGEGYVNGAKYVNPDIEVIKTYHPGGIDTAFTDPEWGATTSRQALENGADVVFAAGGKTGNGGLIEVAGEEGALCIGVDTDQWTTVPEAHPCLISSSMKMITDGVFDLISQSAAGSMPSGNYAGAVGLAPFHDFDSMVSDDVKSMLATLKADLESGAMSPCVWDADSNPACAGGGASAPALAPPEVTDISICTAPTYGGLPVFVAGDMGVFESFGFTSWEYVTCASGPANAAALVAGEVDFVANTPDNMLGLRESGFDVVMFGAAQNGHFFDILAATGQPVVEGDWEATMQALEGTNVGVVARGAAAEQLARELYEQAGVDPENSTYIATGLGGTTVAAMEGGEIDWAITFEPGMTMGVVNGIGTRPFSLVAGDGPTSLDWPSLVNTTSREFAAANPNTVAAYSAALEAASAWIMDEANTDAALGVMADHVGLVGSDMAADVHAANKDYFAVDSTLDADRLMNNVNYALGRGIISESMNFADFAVSSAGVPEKLVTALAAACPSPLVIQTDWFPESEHGALYEMIGAGYTIDADNMVVTGPGQIGGAPLGIDIEVRTGGPAIGWSPVASYMYTDDSIHIGYANTEAQAQLVDTPLISVMAPLEKNPQMIMWDPDTYPDVTSIADLGAQGVTINVFAGGVFIEVWIAEGVVSADQVDPSYDGGPAVFIANDGAIAQQGFASAEPYQYQNEFAEWGKPVQYELLHDTGFEVYSQTLGVRPADMEDMRACLELFVPVVQQSVVNFSSNPARANAIIVDAVDTFGSFWVYSMELGEYSVATMNELGLHGNGPDSTVGNMEESRIQGVIDKMVAAGMEVTTTNASDLFTNEFIDMSIGFTE
jgi:basic membrane protein A